MIKKAIIPAAGYGTRGLPITKVIPKEMFPIGVKPAIHYVVEEAIDAGIEHILIVVSRTKSLIVDYFDESLELDTFLERNNKQHLKEKNEIPKVQLHYTRQPYAKGLGDAIRLGETFIGNEPFAVLLPDDIIHPAPSGLKELTDSFMKTNRSVIGLKEIDYSLLSQYGVIHAEEKKNGLFNVRDIVEKPKENPPSNLAVVGRYVFTPNIFTYLKSLTPGHGGEVQLTDAIKGLLGAEEIYGKELSGKRYDIGKIDDYIELINKMK